ncbi:acyl CoA:acetate/3-ketoacid CoA transferase [Natrarchaeobaculum sulfurireducens]|uniref:Acetyl-CoA:acetoacetyl-CoA transferase, alpha subunit n=1 Tax=Natrarchaeobaculum sulfurireducens TaxID=2044521 RepID=A0A346PU29_9EURY|nr:CoA-transferase [Natrarchaeobaculum sulfurireducens]AXR83024.1 Acetyl-CoA:acetoacetyl-CoA transferase, alpha subunit [Natrarchaeobaculum sulfurireducens]
MTAVQSRDAALDRIGDGDTVGIGGFVAVGIPEHLLEGLGERYAERGSPGDLTLYHPAAEGDRQGRGLSHLVQDGMLERTIASHWGFTPDLMEWIVEGEIEAYNLPFGVMDHLLRDTAAGKPGTITHVGLGTFADPRQEGAKANDVTDEDIVELVTLDGEEYLFYHSVPIDVAILRGTTADENGNVTMEREALESNVLAMAQAAHNSGGTVIVQVERVTETGTLDPKEVVIPGVLVDAVVEAPASHHPQTYAEPYSPAYSGEIRPPADDGSSEAAELDVRKIIARRAAMELSPDSVINLGVGVPERIPEVAAEGGISDEITQTVESGPVGGSASGGISFGTATGHEALVSSTQQFDFYDGGGLDFGFLGMAQIDAEGNVNVSRFGSQLPGCGGFINITQNAEQVVFCGTLTTGDFDISAGDGELSIDRDGDMPKFRESVEQITFSGEYARRIDQPVTYVTERAVFELREEGLTLTEIAPGVDLEADVLEKLECVPAVADDVAEMDARLFDADPFDLTDAVN